MTDKLNDFNKMVSDYYKNKVGKEVEFDLFHVKAYDRMHEKRFLFVPVLVQKDIYDEKYSNDLDYSKRTFTITDVSYDDSYKSQLKIISKIFKVIPGDAYILNDEEIFRIALEYGYDKIAWEVYDKYESINREHEEEWITNYFGLKGSKNERPDLSLIKF